MKLLECRLIPTVDLAWGLEFTFPVECKYTKQCICAREIELVQLSTGKPALEKRLNIAIDDRFKLKIPVTDQFMTWEVLLNCSLPNCPPDFDLNDIDFYYSLTLDSMEDLLPSLNEWDHRKDKALINVISELRSAYLKYQVERLDTIDNRCAYDYTSLINESRIPADQVEVFIDNNTVHFLIKPDMNLPLILPTEVSEEYIILLAVRYGAHGSVRTTSLLTAPSVNQLIGTNLELPRTIKTDESLSEYADFVARSAENQVVTIFLNRQKKRKDFIFEMLKWLGHSVLSYDAQEYQSASFFVMKDEFVCILEVRIPSLFPQRAPQYRLMSVHSSGEDGKPLMQFLHMPYSETWDVPTMVDQALNVITTKHIPEFRDYCMSVFQIPN
ncbi:BRISC and BRCA1-A complex member 2-like isoform X3 [Homalodisca vitripennis]|uniref:BRISC and BRCA1-A complex member 2-like isoform X3 n=1 Tax=Homalodisca vitripennis TaxID=197043 RepID=UPI001EEB1C5E|nr:BRISC and BRCA1-A complex member 2-like isoform X3 [Homalodisca vitripennis]